MHVRRRPLRSRAVGIVAVVVAGTAGVLVPATAASAGGRVGVPASTVRWVRAVPVCARPTPGTMSCLAERLVRVAPHSAHAVRLVRTANSAPLGPAGGYTPDDLATAYGVPTTPTTGTGQAVAIVDAFHDPNVEQDLDTFDAHYGLPAETATSFRVVNGADGTSTPAPIDTSGWSGEIALDVQAVRSVCRGCSILLVEATSDSDADLEAAENTAARLGAIEISNSFGAPEFVDPSTSADAAAFNHPGIIITASAGDDGWYDWDATNAPHGTSGNSPELPAAYNTVIGVGGTALTLNSDGTRAGESVWNDNGRDDDAGYRAREGLGAGGGGCSTDMSARSWQSSVAGYVKLGCRSGKRSAVDVAADADPDTGLDVYNSFGTADETGWQTVGGTSLASPLIAGMWAAAGGDSYAAPYPSLYLYGNFGAHHGVYDVTRGGNGACDGDSPSHCASTYPSGSPNTWAPGNLIDCAFGRTGRAVLANRAQCYAGKGYDGPTGVGTPNGSALFADVTLHPKASGKRTVVHGTKTSFAVAAASDPFPGAKFTSVRWTWGDTHTSTGAKATHAWSAPGTYSVQLAITDSYGMSATGTFSVTVK